jgi:plasmid segregation protein ParM
MAVRTVIGAIDVGYGHTKYVVRSANDEDIEGSFPSFAANSNSALGSGGALARLRVMAVEVNNKRYLVGQDSVLATDGRIERQRDPSYCTSDAYHALTLAALAYMRQPVIDVLVLGLPLSTLPTYRAHLEKKYTGRIVLPAPHTLGVTQDRPNSVDIKRVLVVPQPAGALMTVAHSEPELRKTTNLVVDLGYFTMDFLCTNGLSPLPARSGAVEGGMSGFLDELHAAATSEYEKLLPGVLPGEFRMPHHQYEVALQGDKILRTSAGDLPLKDAVQQASSKLDQYLDMVAARVGNTDEILHVVLAGGGAELLAPRFKARFPRMRRVLTPAKPQMSIVQGYALAGASLARVESAGAAH